MCQRVAIATEGSRPAAYGEVVAIYSPVLLAIGAFWFAKPWRPTAASVREVCRFRLALTCTVLFNLAVLAVLGAYHFRVGDPMAVTEAVEDGVLID